MAEKEGEGSSASSPKRRSNDVNGSPFFADFSSSRQMLREEPDAARAEREAITAAARAERQAAAAEQRRLLEEVFELRLQLASGS